MLTGKNYAASACRYLFASACLPMFLLSCKKEQDSQQLAPAPMDVSGSLKQAIIARGYSESSIEDKGNRYVVEGDIAFYKADSALYVQKAHQAAHQRQQYLVDFYLRPIYAGSPSWEQRFVSYYIDNSLTNSGNDYWYDAVNEAATEWNKVSLCGIFLSRASQAVGADIILSADNGDLPTFTLGQGSGTSSAGQPGPTVKINLDYNNDESLSAAQKKFAIVHELGHCLGFYHTNEPNSGTLIPGTPSSDPTSVMKSTTAGVSWTAFSAGDILASRILYPYPLKDVISQIIGNLGAPETGYAPISWNDWVFGGGTVKIELFDAVSSGGKLVYVYRRTIAAAAPNNGTLTEAIDFSTDISNENLIVKITSNGNTGLYSFSNQFRMRHD